MAEKTAARQPGKSPDPTPTQVADWIERGIISREQGANILIGERAASHQGATKTPILPRHGPRAELFTIFLGLVLGLIIFIVAANSTEFSDVWLLLYAGGGGILATGIVLYLAMPRAATLVDVLSVAGLALLAVGASVGGEFEYDRQLQTLLMPFVTALVLTGALVRSDRASVVFVAALALGTQVTTLFTGSMSDFSARLLMTAAVALAVAVSSLVVRRKIHASLMRAKRRWNTRKTAG